MNRSKCLLATTMVLASTVAVAAPVSLEMLQKATAISLGNMAWESVKVSAVRTESELLKWTADTPTGKWLCQANSEAKKPYCDR